ncbi:MAG: response regulator [Lachnospiraceae bacterium]|nr:response regulator [Lachnospiraceae bacterium]
MDKYKVLLVDDEENVINVILKKINWEDLGFEVIGYAQNGTAALEMAEEEQPDVVMTDIKMPYMDGLELSRHLKDEFPNVKILLFTGFDEFEYAKEAIHLEVEEYVLKPIDKEELTGVFSRIKNNLDQETVDRNNLEKLEKYYMDSLPLLQMNFYTTLIEGSIKSDYLQKFMDDYRISMEGPYFSCAMVHASKHHLPEGMTPVLLNIYIENYLKEKMKSKWKAKIFSYLGDVVMLIECGAEKEISEFTDDMNRMCRMISHQMDAVVTCGVGKVCSDLMKMNESYNGAREAVSYRVIYGTGRAINISEVVPIEESNNPIKVSDESTLNNLFKKILMSDEEDIRKSSDNYVDNTLSKIKDIKNYKIAIMELVSNIYRFAANNHIETSSLSDSKLDLYNELPQMELMNFREWLSDFSVSMHKAVLESRSNTTRSFVSKSIDYLKAHFNEEELSLDEVSGEMGVSSSYFSSVFKKETGKSFVSYLTDYRLDRALVLLMEKQEKTYVIANMVGYSDPNYFSYVFKKKYGMSPSKYKQSKTFGDRLTNV